jgi:hypothetical protein
MEDSKELAVILANCSEAGLQAFNSWMVYKYVNLFVGVVSVVGFLFVLVYIINTIARSMK